MDAKFPTDWEARWTSRIVSLVLAPLCGPNPCYKDGIQAGEAVFAAALLFHLYERKGRREGNALYVELREEEDKRVVGWGTGHLGIELELGWVLLGFSGGLKIWTNRVGPGIKRNLYEWPKMACPCKRNKNLSN